MEQRFLIQGLYRQFDGYRSPEKGNRGKLLSWCLDCAGQIAKSVHSVQWVTVCEMLQDSPFGPPPFDVFSEIGFSNLDALRAAYDSGHLRKISQGPETETEIKGGFIGMHLWAREYVVRLPDGPATFPSTTGMYRQIGSYKCPPHITKQRLLEWWFHHAERGRFIPGIKWYTICEALEESPFGPPAIDAYAEDWFENLQSLMAVFNTPAWQKAGSDGMEEFGFDVPGRRQSGWVREYVLK
jgi:hypothetical protein